MSDIVGSVLHHIQRYEIMEPRGRLLKQTYFLSNERDT